MEIPKNFDMKSALNILKSLNISPNSLTPDKLERIQKLGKKFEDPSEINQESIDELVKILNIKPKETFNEEKNLKKPKQKRNELCNCNSGIKYKKCCGKCI